MFCGDFTGDTMLDLFLDSVPIAAGTEDVETMFILPSDDENENNNNVENETTEDNSEQQPA